MTGPRAHVVVATCAALVEDRGDDGPLVDALADRGVDATIVPWDAPGFDWAAPDLVVIRSTWDYTFRRDEFVAWADAIGDRLHNPPALVRWNSDKRYLADLAADGIPVVATAYVAPGDPVPDLDGEVVVKPTVSAGARETGRFGPATHDAARALIATIHAAGRTAMVQPYLASVDTAGETAVVVIDGEVSHTLRKGAVLRPDEVAPLRGGDIGAAEAMYDPDLVRAAPASDAAVVLARRLVGWVGDRFGGPPLYARVDLVAAADGTPTLMELEAVEPALYTGEAPGAAGRLADAVIRRLPA